MTSIRQEAIEMLEKESIDLNQFVMKSTEKPSRREGFSFKGIYS